MTTAEVLRILTNLAEGIDPTTGDKLPVDGLFHHPDVIRALFIAIDRVREPATAIQTPEPRAVGLELDRMKNAGRSWSESEITQLLDDVRSGVRLMEIARIHSRSRGAILERLVQLGFYESRDDARAAIENGLRNPTAWDTLKKERPRAGRIWTHEEDKALLRAADEGKAPDEIAQELGRGEFSVQVRLAKLRCAYDTPHGN
jgi:predicted transcriptional regulator